MNSFRKLVSFRPWLLSVFEAMLVAGCYIAAIYLVRPLDADTYLEYDGGFLRVALVGVIFLVASYLFNFYTQTHARFRLLLGLQVAHLVGILLLLQAVLAFIDPNLVLPQTVVLLGSGLVLALLVLWRVFVRSKVWSAFAAQHVVFVGAGKTVQELDRAFRTEPGRGMEVVGYFLEPHEPPPCPEACVLGTTDDLMRVASEVLPDRIIVDPDSVTDPAALKELLDLRAAGITVQTASQAYESSFARVDARGLHPYTVVFLNELQAPPQRVALQAIYTNILALVAAVVSLPVTAFIAVLLRATRRGPVFSASQCVGFHGIPFHLYRFRCPATDRSWLGRFLLRFKLYRLPNVVNLIRGEIALIGPRPEPLEVDRVLNEMIPFYTQKQSVKPGIFGWSQLHCDSEPEEDTLRRLEYDLYYIKHVSVALDLYIVLRAIKRVLSGQGDLSEA